MLGLGLIGIGRRWGFVPGYPPDDAGAQALLTAAWELGIRHFDTAPSYGASEVRLGNFLAGLSAAERGGLTVATKFGEHWDAVAGAPFVDHSYDALRRSLDQSLARLGRIDVLQLHKTRPEVLASRDLERAWEYAAAASIPAFGASVSDPESAAMVCQRPEYRVMQIPFNRSSAQFAPAIRRAAAAGLRVVVNRPFEMGKMCQAGPNLRTRCVEAFAFVRAEPGVAVVLSGTRNAEHLRWNLECFREAEALRSSRGV